MENNINETYTVVNAPVKQRRVGTFTLGLTLILIGILIPMTLFFKDKALLLLQFAPIVLVMLGVEVLIYAFKIKDGKLKYDGFSIFLVIMITIVSISTASVAPIVSRVIANERVIEEVRIKGVDAVESALMKNGLKGDVHIYDMRQGPDYWFDQYEVEDVQTRASVYLYLKDGEQVPKKEEIVAVILPFLNDIDYKFNSIGINVVFENNDIASVDMNQYQLERATEESILLELNYHWDSYEEPVQDSFEEQGEVSEGYDSNSTENS
ncbi:MAG: hypothetical protein RR444_02275 [Oscillospiraceae bacterium]